MKMKNSTEFPVVLMRGVQERLSNITGILDQCRKFGWRLVDLNVTNGIVPQGCHVIGAIVGYPADYHKLEILKNQEFPLVRIGILPHPLDKKVPAVITDFEAVGRVAAEHFIGRNFKHVGYIGHIPWSNARIMYDSFKKFSEEHGVSCHLLRFHSFKETLEKRYRRRESKLNKWLANLPKPVGVLTYKDVLASTITTMCQSIGLAVPEEVAVLGCGNNEQLCETTLVPISSIDTGTITQGREAVNLLHSLIQGKTVPKSPIIISPVGVVERESTDVLAVPDKLVANSLRFIWDNLEVQLSIDDIAREFGVSRSILDHAFKRHLGRSPSAERLRKRLERCSELLRGSELNIAEIARTVGFPSISYLHRSFKAEFGMTLKAYRKTFEK